MVFTQATPEILAARTHREISPFEKEGTFSLSRVREVGEKIGGEMGSRIYTLE